MSWLYFGLIVYCGILSTVDYIKTRKPYKLVYVLFWAYMFLGLPILETITSKNIIHYVYMFLGIIPMLIFICWDLMQTKKAN